MSPGSQGTGVTAIITATNITACTNWTALVRSFKNHRTKWVLEIGSPARVSNLWSTGRMQPRMAMNAAQHKIINLLKTFFFAHQFLLVFVYLMCGPGQLFFFQCGLKMPKGWTASGCLCPTLPHFSPVYGKYGTLWSSLEI